MDTPSTPRAVSLATRIRRRLKAGVYSGFARDRWQQPDDVLAALELRPGMKVADLGAGGGYLTFRLAQAVGPDGCVYAVDTDQDMTSLIEARAQQQNVGNVITIDARPRDPGLPERVDLVVIVDAFHHLPHPSDYLRTLAGVLADEGRLAIIEPRPTWWLFGHATAVEELRSRLGAAGYEVSAEHDFLPRQNFLIAQPVDRARREVIAQDRS